MASILEGTKDGAEVVREVETLGICVPLKQWSDGHARRQDLPARIAYGSHKSARMQPVHVDEKVLGDAVKGWAVVLPKHSWRELEGLCVSPLGAVTQKEKVRVVHDLSLSVNNDCSVNDMTDEEFIAPV